MIGRPRTHDNLRPITVLIETEIITNAKESNINISEVCRDALLNALNDPILFKKFDKFARIPKEVLDDCYERIRKDTSLVVGCVNIIKKETGIRVNANELLERFEKDDRGAGRK